MTLLIRNGRVVTAVDDYVADVLVEGEVVTRIGRDLELEGDADEVFDATGKLVIPGGIDPHVHFDLPMGPTVAADDFETGSRAAAHGGTTTVIDFPTQSRGRSMFEALDEWRAKAEGKACIDYGFHMIVTDLPEERLPELTRLVEEGIPSFKLFTAYPDRLFVDDGTLYRAMRQAAEDGAVVLMHAENGIVIDEIVKRAVAEGRTEPRWHALTRPPRMEAEGVHRSIAIAEVAGASLYIVHMSCAAALEEVARARHRGVPVFAETCPQYLFLDESLYHQEGFEGAKYVMTPVLRSPEDQAALWRGLQVGEVHAIGTDHCPFSFETQKVLGRDDFRKIPNGGPGVENRMSLLYHGGVVEGRLGLNDFVRVTSTFAARMFGLFPRKGTVAVGSDADLVIFDPERRETLSVDNPVMHHMRVDYNPYEGRVVQGVAETVIARGEVLVRDTEFVGRPGRGRFLKRERYTGRP